MKFLSPLGLLGLIGIPILILIYIIKSKYREYTISSTYIWELSEKFLPKKSPISKLSGILSLILQMLIVLFLSFSISHPILSIPNAAKNYLFVLDNSASMNISSRFKTAKEKMIDIVKQAKSDSTFTIVVASLEGNVVCVNQKDKEKTIRAIDQLKISTLASNLSTGLSLAQEYFDHDSSLNVYLFSDIYYAQSNNIEIVNVAQEEYNASIHSLYYTLDEENIQFIGEMISYQKDQTIDLNLYLDSTFEAKESVECLANQLTKFSFTIDKKSFEEAKVVLAIEDDLSLDNQYILYGNQAIDQYKILLVSDTPFYLKSVLSIFGETSITTIKPANYHSSTGYDLYVFDSYSPALLPEDGAIWLFNIQENIANAGFVAQEQISVENGANLSLTNQKNDIYQTLTQNLTGNTVSVSKYVKYTLLSPFTAIMNYQSQPMVFAGENANGNRQITFSFALSDSNFPLTIDFVILFNNMLKYSIPQLCNQTLFYCGDELILNVLNNCESIRLNTPSGYSTYLNLTNSTTSYFLNEIGTYEIEAIMNHVIKYYKIYVAFPILEENPFVEEDFVELIGTYDDRSFDSSFDLQWIMLILLFIVCIIEWEVYLYEQREMR